MNDGSWFNVGVDNDATHITDLDFIMASVNMEATHLPTSVHRTCPSLIFSQVNICVYLCARIRTYTHILVLCARRNVHICRIPHRYIHCIRLTLTI